MTNRPPADASQEIVVYAGPGVEASLPLDRERERETVWASQAQIVDLFSLIVSSVSRHVNNIFRDSEVDRESNLKIANCFCGPTAFVLQPGRHSRSVLPRQIKPRHRFPPLGERGTHRFPGSRRSPQRSASRTAWINSADSISFRQWTLAAAFHDNARILLISEVWRPCSAWRFASARHDEIPRHRPN